MMKDTRSLSGGPNDGGEVKSALAELLKKSFSDTISSGNVAHQREAAIEGASSGYAVRASTPTRSPSKARSLSDSTPKLSPSPKIKEHTRRSKDDHNLQSTASPRTPRRPEFLARGLSLQMPPRDSLGIASPTNLFRAPPLSPRVDKKDIYGSPSSVLPRHSRGLDFARACTNLHHSTLAESSPDSSPTITQKGMMIPPRKMSMNAMAIDVPHYGWTAQMQEQRSVISSSLGSVNMLASDSSSSSDDDLEPMDNDEVEDAIISTPQVMKRNNPTAATPFAGSSHWAGAFSPGAANFQNFHRARLRNGRSRKSSSSASGHSSLASPVPQSPPPGKMNGDGYFPRDVTMRGPASRRESVSLLTNDLHISSGNDSADEATRPPPSTPGVIRRVVTRRGNLLPKTRAFGRIRAELQEETTPVDAEVKREAEVIRQVRESDAPELPRNDSITASSSPTLQAVDSLAEALQGIPEDKAISSDSGNTRGLFGAFARQPSSASGKDFWTSIETQHRTPPPPFFPRLSTSTSASDDISIDSPVITTPITSVFPWAVPSKEVVDNSPASIPPHVQPINAPISAADGLRKQNKRRRDDDLDMASMKRRAVSPGVSVGNSPILSHSPGQRSDTWGKREGGERNGRDSSSSVAHTPQLGPKRVGLQGMNDVQGMAEKMSIE